MSYLQNPTSTRKKPMKGCITIKHELPCFCVTKEPELVRTREGYLRDDGDQYGSRS